MKRIAGAMLLWVAAGAASAQTYGDWAIKEYPDSVVAYTSNDSGNLFAKTCLPDQGVCLWTLIATTSCTQGQKTPVLVNANSGSYSMMLDCGSSKEYSYQYFLDPDTIDSISDQDNEIGIALPMVGGTFRVLRFSLAGSDKAVREGLRRAQARKTTSTRDITL